jgi:hypothetical protein
MIDGLPFLNYNIIFCRIFKGFLNINKWIKIQIYIINYYKQISQLYKRYKKIQYLFHSSNNKAI